MNEHEQLQDQILFIDERLAVIHAKLPHASDYARSEMTDEASSLSGTRRACIHRLEALGSGTNGSSARRDDRVEKLRAARIRSYRAQCMEAAEAFEAQNDHRNARLHRLEALNASKVAAHEVHE